MAKDGTRRGGARPGAGRKPKALADKIKDGQKASVMMVPAELESVEMPPIRDFLTEEQRDGTKLCSEEIYNETYRWLKERRVHRKASDHQCRHRFTLCEDGAGLYETGEHDLERDLPDRKGKLLGGVQGEPAGLHNGASASGKDEGLSRTRRAVILFPGGMNDEP